MRPAPVPVNAPPEPVVSGVLLWRADLPVSGDLESLPWLLQGEARPGAKQNKTLFNIQFDSLKFESVSNNFITGLTVLLALKSSHFCGGVDESERIV